MEVRLISLEMEGFRSFQKRTVINFPPGDSIMLVSGKWKNSGTSSGSGKTSILEAIAVLLDISGLSQTRMKNWYSKKMFLKLALMIGPDVVEITRDPKLSIAINGEEWNSLQKGAKEKLEDMLGCGVEMRRVITYRKQRVKGVIVRSTDAQLKEFLTEPIGLGEVESAAEEFTKEANALSTAMELTKRDIQHYETNLNLNFISDEDLQAAYLAYQNAEGEWARISNSKAVGEDVRADLEKLKVDQTEVSRQLNLAQSEVLKINNLTHSVNAKRNENANIKSQVLKLQADVEKLEKSACPTCEREWDAAKAFLDKKNKEIDQFIDMMKVNIEYIKNSQPVFDSLPTIEARYKELLNQQSAMHVKQQELNNKLGSLNAPFQMAESAMRSASSNYQTLQQKRKNYNTQSEQLTALKRKLAAEESKLSIVQGSAMLLGRSGFLGSIFDEILADIEVRTNDMLSYFPNANQFTVEIDSTKEVKSKGTTKKEISINISRSGIDVSFDEDLSGGQQSAIELCSDLAAAETIRARSGCALKWICLDEVMDGLGPSEKQEVVAMIRERVKGLVLMIEHSNEIKESFDNVIEIEYDGKESYVKSV
jgi:DNA repair exonuclease SbcCD ATPase subunit